MSKGSMVEDKKSLKFRLKKGSKQGSTLAIVGHYKHPKSIRVKI
jgi:hypothetical protein